MTELPDELEKFRWVLETFSQADFEAIVRQYGNAPAEERTQFLAEMQEKGEVHKNLLKQQWEFLRQLKQTVDEFLS